MPQTEFVHNRRADWERLEALLNRVGSRRLRDLKHSELVEIRVLYRRAAGDLAWAQSNSNDDRLLDYLNDLVARGHGLVYSPPKASLKAGLVELFYSGPETIRKGMPYVLMALGVFLVGAAAGVMLVVGNPSWTWTIIPADFRPSLELWKKGVDQPPEGFTMFAMSGFYHVHNSLMAIVTFGSGIAFGLFPLFLLFDNGLVMGAFGVELARSGHLLHFFAGIAPHGVTELSAIFFSGGGGFMLAHAVIAPGELSRAEALREKGKDAFWLLAVALALLVEAAIVEAYFSHLPIHPAFKFAFAAVALSLLVGFIYGVRRPAVHAAG